eukprot:2043458-Amphidinium_carterae.8
MVLRTLSSKAAHEPQTSQEYETTHNTKISDGIKIAAVVSSVRGQLRNHLLLHLAETTEGHQPMKIDSQMALSITLIQEKASLRIRVKDPVRWKGPVYQLDATNSVQPPMPLESGTIMMDNNLRVVVKSRDHWCHLGHSQ